MIKYRVDICPECKLKADYVPNPERVYNCGCGFEGYERDLIKAVDSDKINEDIEKLSGLLRKFPSVNFLQGRDD
ncbi:hypothetical protein HOE04_00650 [archaeon]|jgi:hypothetical protein|nr:hypothetical protein [archaeon]